jgi:signal peptidase
MNPLVQRAVRLATRVLGLVSLGGVLFACTVLLVLPRATNGAALTVLTGSMTPKIPVGSVVVERPVDPGTLRVGDIATYQPLPGKAEYITHRITKIDATKHPVEFTFKGDANRGADLKPVPAGAIRGKVWFHVPYLGTLRNAVSGGGLALPLAVLGLAGYAVSQVLAARREKKPAEAEGSELPAVGTEEEGAFALQSLVVTLRVTEFEGLPPGTVADMLHMDLIEADQRTFAMSTTRRPHDLDRLVEALTPFDPIALRTSELMWLPLPESELAPRVDATFHPSHIDPDEHSLAPSFHASA